MPKSLAEMRASEHVGLPELTYPLCLAGKVVDEVDIIDAELADLFAQVDSFGEDGGKPGRLGGKSDRGRVLARIDELNVLRDEKIEVMNEHLAEVRVRAKQGHEWRKFIADRPPRDNVTVDRMFGANVDKVIDDLGDFVVDVNGKPLEPGDWEFVLSKAAPGELKDLVGKVTEMHNGRVSIPKSLRSSATTPGPSNG